MKGGLMERDGIPLFDDSSAASTESVEGSLLYFIRGQSEAAYKKISKFEPSSLYAWKEMETETGTASNVLVANSLDGADQLEEAIWDGAKDLLFTDALATVEFQLRSVRSLENRVEQLFSLQMAYLLLWTSIERYASLRYGLGDQGIMEKIHLISKELAFAEALKRHGANSVLLHRKIYPTYKNDAKVFSHNAPQDALDCYYQIRCNITHRGKALFKDINLLKGVTSELIKIFRDTKDAAFAACG